jgi:S1-C subfamily serine protease
VARVVICPSCQAKGAIPDDAKVARIRCPKCGFVHKIGAEDGPEPTTPPPVTQASPSGTGRRRAPGQFPAAGPRPPATPSNAADNRLVLFALLGVSGLAVVLLGVVLALLMTRGGQGGGGAAGPGAGGPVAAAPQGGPDGAGAAPTVPIADLVPPPAGSPGPAALASSTTRAGDPATGTSAGPVAADRPAPQSTVADAATPPDPQEILRRLKEATVFVKSKIGGKTVSTGSGFVIEVNGDSVVVATNRHVAVMDLSELPPDAFPQGSRPELEAVFRSGLGPEQEQALPASIIAADMSGDLNTDLAFLRVKGVKRPPAPIDPFVRTQPTEGMTYLGAGFPLVGLINQIAESKGNPSVTITGGRLAGIRRDEHGLVTVFQVDGSLHPGNSGGPIIEERTGRLLGVAVASTTRIGISTVGFIVPADQVRHALGGKVGALDLTLESNQQGKANLLVKANLVDPRMQVAGVVVRAAPFSAIGKLSPNSDGSWRPLPNAPDFELQRNPRAPEAVGRVQVALSGTGMTARKILIQAAHRDPRGRLVYSKPKEVTLPTEPGRIMPPGTLERLVKSVRTKSLALLGPLVDPSKDCRLDKDEANFKVRIDVPGKLHTLQLDHVNRNRRPMHNAPMTLTDVDGDFAAIVEVTGEINPGPTPPSDRQTRNYAVTMQSAGLIVYQDKDNFLRLERAAGVAASTLTPLHRLIIEGVKEGKPAMQPIYVDVPEGNTFLVLIRRKGRLQCLYSPDGGRSGLKFPTFAFSLPAKVKVGLSASNISAQPFSAAFENFALVSDVTKIDRALDGE